MTARSHTRSSKRRKRRERVGRLKAGITLKKSKNRKKATTEGASDE